MAKPAKDASAEAEAPAKPKGKKILLAIMGVLLLGALGGGAWFFLSGTKHEEKKEEPKHVPVFKALESFTVNLQREEGDQYLQVGITLKLADAKAEELVNERLPEVRSRLLFLLSSKRPSELVPISGKKKLALDIAREVNTVLGIHPAPEMMPAHEGGASEVGAAEQEAASAVQEQPAHGGTPVGGVLDVLFTSFIIQ